MLNLYRRIWATTGQSQILLIILSISIAVLAAVPLQFQKDIINGITSDMERKTLFLLGAAYLGVLVVRNALKFALQYKSSMLSEDVVRRIRKRLYEIGFETTDRGTLITMISSEAEEVGRFAGTAMAAPLMQLGTLVAVVGFIAVNQPYLGLFMLTIVIPQALIAVSVQQRINDRVGYRVRVLRRATARIAAEDIKTASEDVRHDFDEIFEARRRIFFLKSSTKFVMNLITGLGTVGILVLGGLLVLNGRTDVGTVVAALSGLTRISEPWRELLAFYRDLSSVRVKYELLAGVRPDGATRL